MKNKLLILLIFIFIYNFAYTQDKAMILISDRVLQLKSESESKQKKITTLNNQISLLLSINNTTKKQRDETRKELQKKTEELLILSGQLDDLTLEYQKLINEINRLGQLNNDLVQFVEEITIAKKNLQDSIKNIRITENNLLDSLRNNKNQLIVLNSNYNALKRRMESFLNKTYGVKTVEAAFFTPFSGGFSVGYGKIEKGGNLFTSIKIGCHSLGSNSDNFSFRYLVLPVSLDFKFSLDRNNKLNFGILESTITEKIYKFYGNLEVNYGVLLKQSDLRTSYSIGALLGGGIVLDYNENVKPFIFSGIRYNSFIPKKNEIFGNNDVFSLVLGAGIYY